MNTRRNDRWRVRIAVGVVVVCLLSGLAAFLLKPAPEPVPPSTEPQVAQRDAEQAPADRWQHDDFVGSRKCAECHAEIAESFAGHPMANTLATIAGAAPIEKVAGESAEFATQGRWYRVERDGDRMIHTEFMTDDDGELIYEQSEEVNYAVGSGTKARTYLIDRGGVMFESPLTWYTEKQLWDLSPGYHENPAQRFSRRITDGCLQCHSGLPLPVGDGVSARFESPPFEELGISCERCHGPGRRHVERYESVDADADEKPDDTLIVNPAHLEGRQQESVCYQCHMAGKRRILRKGKSYHDFQPGMATEEVWTTFVAPVDDDAEGPAEFVSHVEQMRSSACFRGSEGSLRCTTCHDPHRSPAPAERVEFYRQRCSQCHADRGCSLPLEERERPPAHNSCFHCHMPSSGSDDIPHTTASDHRILRNPQPAEADESESQTSAVWTIFDESDQRMPPEDVERARALALSEQALEESDRRLLFEAIEALERVASRDPDDADVLSMLGYFYCTTGSNAKAMRTLAAALRADPQNELSLKNLAMMSLQTRAFDTGLRSCRRFLEVNPWDPALFGPYAGLLANTGDLQGAVEVVERGLRLDPTQLKLRSFAVQLYDRLGNPEQSRQHQQILTEISRRLAAEGPTP